MPKPNYIGNYNFDFERVDIFLRVKGRLPDQEGDSLTQEILDEYCEKFEKGGLTKGMVPLEFLYNLIKTGTIKTTNNLCQKKPQNNILKESNK